MSGNVSTLSTPTPQVPEGSGVGVGVRTRNGDLLRNVFLKSLRDQIKPILGWGLGLAALAWLTLIFYPEVSKLGQGFNDLLKSMPYLGTLLGDVDSFTTIGGYVTSQLLSYMPLLLSIYAMLVATSNITGEVENGTIDFLLAHPTPRWRVVLEKYAAMLVAILAICVILGLGMSIGGLSIGQGVPVTTWLLSALNIFPITLFYASVTFALACALRGRGIPLGVGAGLAVAGFILNGIAPLVEGLKAYRVLTIYYLFSASKPFSTGLNWLYTGILLVGSLLFLGLALITFERRDITG
jgi:ABC-2 type transport system permease protein